MKFDWQGAFMYLALLTALAWIVYVIYANTRL